LFVAKIPAATPEREITWKLWKPLSANLGVLLRSKALALAVFGIAFFTFIVLFARQTLLLDGGIEKELQAAYQFQKKVAETDGVKMDAADGDPFEGDGALSQKSDDIDLAHPDASPAQRSEMKVAFLIGFISLGIGFGAPLAGALSGNKVELGLVPIGAVFLILFTTLMALVLQWAWVTRICLVLAGMAASFYIVPLYTLLQHRAPKDSKGSLVATSNFINVAGGLVAVGVFQFVTWALKHSYGLDLSLQDAQENTAKLPEYIAQLQTKIQLPRLLFLAASLLTAATLYLLCRQLPDFFVRSLLWLRSHGRYRLKVVGLNNLPSEGPVILATNCDRFETCMQVVTATDRFTRFILLESDPDERPPWLIRYLARRTGLVALAPTGETREAWEKAYTKASATLSQGNLLGITADGRKPHDEMLKLFEGLRQSSDAPILPVYCGALSPHKLHDGRESLIRRMQVVIGQPVAPNATPEQIRQRIHLLGEWMRQTDLAGTPIATSMIPEAVDALPIATGPIHPKRP
jgi:MFS family permease